MSGGWKSGLRGQDCHTLHHRPELLWLPVLLCGFLCHFSFLFECSGSDFTTALTVSVSFIPESFFIYSLPKLIINATIKRSENEHPAVSRFGRLFTPNVCQANRGTCCRRKKINTFKKYILFCNICMSLTLPNDHHSSSVPAAMCTL